MAKEQADTQGAQTARVPISTSHSALHELHWMVMARGFLQQASSFYFDFHEAKTGKRSCFMHDPSAIIAVTDPALFGFEDRTVSVTCNGDEIGRTVTGVATDRRTTRIAMTVDSASVRAIFLSKIKAADRCAQARKTS